ncbi:hypothetical protein BT67DRAFT_441561 [Trichocladium antarcticum]|uniref:Uncharacterized protein n=1 Tax=Trichocladium antarcticum TaxID=1450529 RepID=A0AAN6ZF34_9PEZI|nr:hypothetical protein BT67DRAFT_441561 [Trichocladium antarcticum]
MPPLLSDSPSESGSDLESQDSSDSESVHTIVHSPRSGHATSNAKRKASVSVGESDGRASKALRTESSDSGSSLSDLDDEDDKAADDEAADDETADDEANDADEGDEDEDDDDDTPNHTDCASSASRAATPTVPTLHPAYPQTVRELYLSMFPHEKSCWGGRLSPALDSCLAKRIPNVPGAFNSRETHNVGAFLIQAIGDVVPDSQRCGKCVRGTAVFSACVVLGDPELVPLTGGACANCWYNRRGYRCSLRVAPVPSQASVRAPKPPRRAARPPALNVPASSTPAPVHPSYAAALAAAAAAAAAAPKPAPASASNSTPYGRSLSVEDRVRVWESRYGDMATDKLVAAQEHLNQWQEDLTTRMMAMNKVVLARLKRTEG